MQLIKLIIFFFSFSVLSQENIIATLISKTELQVTRLVQIDDFGTTYYIKDNALSIQKKSKTYSYSNVHLGEITSVNAFNPLKIDVFYKDFNSVVILDNRLAEIVKINFNVLEPFRDITHVSIGSDNTVWGFNQNTQQLELFDYIATKSRVMTLPIKGQVLDIYSNYNFCWLLTDAFMYCYNYFGSLISKTQNMGYSSLQISNGTIFLLKENQLFFKAKNSNKTKEIKLPQLLIKQFLVTNETLYIYDDEFLYRYQLITN